MKIKDVRSMKLTMQLKSRSYDIILKAGCLANLHQFTNVANRKVFVLTDSGVPAEYAQTVAAQCPDSTVYTIPRGEGSKCLKVYGQVLQAMLAFGMDRKDLLVSVGGGVVGDLGGFCAASYMRGIDFVNCPTTVLSQVDSSIGGKTAIDLGETKNIVGAFWQPRSCLSILTRSRPCPAVRSSTAWPRRSRPASSETRSCLHCLSASTPRITLNKLFTEV